MGYDSDQLHKLLRVGEVIKAVYIDDEHTSLVFELVGAKPVQVDAEGNCCSFTWFEHIDNIEALTDAAVRDTIELDMPNELSHPEHDCLQFYGIRIDTDKGSCVIEYRNASNGYYGGSLCARQIESVPTGYKRIEESF